MHDMVKTAIKGLPREKLFIQTKMRWIEDETRLNPMKHLDRFRQEVGTDYFDSVLIHCTTKHTWPEECKIMMDAFDEAQHKGWLKLKGMSCHGLAALKVATQNNWIQLQLARVNPQGRYVDGDDKNVHAPQGKPEIALQEIKAMHDKGRGVIGMKIIGEGDFKDPADREKSIRYAMNCGYVDAIVIGFGSIAQVDEAIERVNRALNA
jgi:predicted aldo/keto reductase-like oxidoreductase